VIAQTGGTNGTSSTISSNVTGGRTGTGGATSTSTVACASGLTRCSGTCLDLTGNFNNCGSCGNVCKTGQTCSTSQCRCPTGYDSCTSASATTLCQDKVSADANNCGACGTVCPTGATCVNSVCQCPTGKIACNKTCIDPATDKSNCGVCGTTCTSTQQCLYGACLDPTTLTCSPAAVTGKTSTKDAFITEGKYWINNNQWGISGASGSQSIWGTCQTGDLVGWGTSWTWSGGSGVKTYASLVFGWQWGWRITNTGLPVQLSSSSAVNCGWQFSLTSATTGVFNVAYDTWLMSTATADANTTPSEEVMVWLYAAGGAGPLGSLNTSNVSIAGATWNLYWGKGGSSWNVASYVRTSNATAATMNMMLFYRDLVTRGLVPNTRYLASIQAGTEVTSGSGELDTTGFYCRIE